VDQPDLLPEVVKVRAVREPAIQDFLKPRRNNGENGNGFPLIDLEIDAGAV